METVDFHYDSHAIIFRERRKCVKHDDEASVTRLNPRDSPAERIANSSEQATGAHALTERDDRLEEAVTQGRMN